MARQIKSQADKKGKAKLEKRQAKQRHSYEFVRPIKVNDVLYEKGDQVTFGDKLLLQFFIKHNYIK